LDGVVNVTISDLALTTTSDLPPSLSGDDLSPVRITWIIIGTLLVFGVGLFLLSRMRSMKYLCCTKTCIEDTIRSWYNTLADGCMLCLRSMGLVRNDLLYYGSGFDLTTQEEEADFYGENRGNVPSDGLDIHYGDNRSQRSQYLEDDDDRTRTPVVRGRLSALTGRLGRFLGLGGGADRSRADMRGAGRGPPSPPRSGVEMRRWSDNNVSYGNRNVGAHTSGAGTYNPVRAMRYSDRFSPPSDASSPSEVRPPHIALPRPPRSYSSIIPTIPGLPGSGSRRPPGTHAQAPVYNILSDNIDDIADFASAGPSTRSSGSDLVEEPLEPYESYVV
jgi:hypothetical protein